MKVKKIRQEYKQTNEEKTNKTKQSTCKCLYIHCPSDLHIRCCYYLVSADEDKMLQLLNEINLSNQLVVSYLSVGRILRNALLLLFLLLLLFSSSSSSPPTSPPSKKPEES